MRAFSELIITKSDADAGLIEGIASTPTPDRVGDVVEPSGAQFKLPLPLLWQHDARQPIGHVTQAEVTESGIKIVGRIARGVTDRIDEAFSLIKAGLVRGLSIGFRGIDTEQIPNSYGIRFKKWEWLELSAVTIPANAEAGIVGVKAADDLALLREYWRRLEAKESTDGLLLPSFLKDRPERSGRAVRLS